MTKRYELSTDWKEVELGEICEVKRGNSITKQKLSEGNIPVIAGGQQPAYYHNIPNRTGETITVSGSGAYAGFVAYFDIPIFASDCSTIQSRENNIFMKYFYYYLKFKQKQIYKMQKGIAQPHVYPKDLAKIKIPLPFINGKPDLETQQKIVAILEKAEHLKEKRKKSIELLDEYVKSVFNEMFLGKGFEEVDIEKGILKTDNKNPIIDFPDNYFYYIDIASVDNQKKEIINYNKMLGKEAPSRAKQQIQNKDVLISTVRPNLNAIALVPEKLDKQICSTGFCILRSDNKNLAPEYLFYTLQTNLFIKYLVRKCKGANYPAVSNNDIKSLKIPFPPIVLQQKFSSIVEHAEKLKEKQRKSKEQIDELFNVLMQKAFNGELVR